TPASDASLTPYLRLSVLRYCRAPVSASPAAGDIAPDSSTGARPGSATASELEGEPAALVHEGARRLDPGGREHVPQAREGELVAVLHVQELARLEAHRRLERADE